MNKKTIENLERMLKTHNAFLENQKKSLSRNLDSFRS